ncbi:hypothetical protein [Bradyrhizobium genosp. P]|uniref:hypothetical protein n=1 Tax=Bradyrhizobium genosp. P TaxID=83641 RepID=UPI003CF1E10F
MYRCFVCDQMFEFGKRAGVYDGRVVQGWNKQMICHKFEGSNWDGIVPTPKLLSKFEEEGLKVDYNAKGFIIIPAILLT